MNRTNLTCFESGPALSSVLLLALVSLVQPAAAALPDLAGRYVGSWTNLTFGSVGKAVIEIQISGEDAALIFDMDGFVFGQVDPPLITMPGTVQGDSIVIDSQGVGIFGDISGSVDGLSGTLDTTLTNVPGGYIQRVTNTGTITNGVISIEYTVDFQNQPPSPTNPAHGVMVAALAVPFEITEIRREGTGLVLSWTGGGGPFTVQTRTNLVAGDWSDVGAPVDTNRIEIPIQTGGAGFFRVSGH